MLEYLTQSTWVERIGWVLVHSLWQFALLALVAIVLRRALQRSSAATRYGALLAAMSMMVVAPVATWFLPWSADAPALAAKRGVAENAHIASPSQHGDDSLAIGLPAASSHLEAAASPRASLLHGDRAPVGLAAWWLTVKARVQPWLPQIVLVWLAGVLVLAVRPLLSWHTVRRLRRAGVSPVAGAVRSMLERTAARLRLTSAVEVLQSTLVHAPVVLGYFRPVVLLPVSVVTGLPAAQLESILAHELAHIRRHDYLVNLLQTLVETLFFYHPAVWWLSRQIRNERENCSDDVAMAAVGSRADYGRALLAIEELRATPTALSLAARGGSLLARIRRIAGCEPAPSAVGGGSVMGVGLVSIAIVAACLWGAAPAAEKTTADAATNSKDALLDPLALLQAYEKTLVPYQRVKAKWVERFARLNSVNEPEWLDREPDEWTVVRDGDRAKSTVTITWKKTGEKGQLPPRSEEHVWEKGKPLVSVHPPHPGPGSRDPNAPIVIGDLEASAEDFMRHTGFGLGASRGILSDIRWIPTFLRGAQLSAERDTLDGHAVDVLRGVSDENEITLWLDPALGHVPRKVSYDKRSSALNSPPAVHVYEVKRFEEREGVWVPVEAIETTQTPAHPAIGVVTIKVVNGKGVLDFTPRKDEHGEIVTEPAGADLCEAKLADIQFHPKFTDEDFKISRPVPDGTKVSVPLGPFARHVTYQWRQGKIVKVVEPAIKGKFDPTADAKAQIAEKLKLAKWVKESVLVIFAANAWQRCAALEEAFQSNPETLWPLLDDQHLYAYQVVLADVTNPANRALAAGYGLTLDDRQSPCVTVLDADGRVRCNQDLAAFSLDGRYQPDKLVAFLKQWEAPPENAEEVLRVALERAVKEQKMPFVVFTGAHCVPCHLLTDFLGRWQEVLGQDYILVEIDADRMTHVAEVKARVGHQSDPVVGVPWYAILSPAGDKLVTSMGPKGNIGFASEQPGIEHFMNMLRQTASHISPEKMKAIEAALATEKTATGQGSESKSVSPTTDAETAVRKPVPALAPTAQEAKKQDPAVRTLPVRVVDVDGKPIPGAKVHSNAVAAAVGTARREIINRNYVTDADGRAAVELPKTVDLLRIWARKDGLVPMFAHWEQQWFAAGRPVPDEVTIMLKKGTTIGGFVKNEEGQPIAGARIGVAGLPNLLRMGVDVEHLEVDMWLADNDDPRITDAEGRWTLDNVPEGNDLPLKLSVTHPDYISDLSWGGLQDLQGVTTASLREQKATIVMAHGISLTGSVTDPQGKGIAGAVVVWGDDPYSQTGRHQEHRQQVRTDANGLYRLPPMPPMTMTVTVIAERWMPSLKKVTITRENPKVDFPLKTGRILRVRFVDSSGKPIPGVGVGIEGWRGGKSLYNTKHAIVLETRIPDRADKNGVYEWTWAPDDEVQYQFYKEGYKTIASESIIADGAEHTITLAR